MARLSTIRILLSFALTAAAPAATYGQYVRPHAMENLPAGPQSAAAVANAPAQPLSSDYVLGPSDLIRVTVWKEPELTQNAVVRPDGKISFPLVGEVPIAGLTVLEAEDALTDKLKKVLAKPEVTITVSEIHSRQVYITGEVGHPGAYPLPTTMNVLQLIASAGGLTQYAHKKGIYILRGGADHPLRFNYKEVTQGKDRTQNIDLMPGDTVVIP